MSSCSAAGTYAAPERVSGEEAERLRRPCSTPCPAAIKYAMGDGNHSLAAAKLCWEQLKPTLSEAERDDQSRPLRPGGDSEHTRRGRGVQAHTPTGDRRGRRAPGRGLRPRSCPRGAGNCGRRCHHGTAVRHLGTSPGRWESWWRLRTGLWASCSGGVRRRGRLRARRRESASSLARDKCGAAVLLPSTGQRRALRLHSRDTAPIPRRASP